VENAGAITRGNPSEKNTIRHMHVVKLKQISLRQAVNNAHEQRQGKGFHIIIVSY